MTRHGTVLPIPDDPRIAELIAQWGTPTWTGYYRSRWLSQMEALLRENYLSQHPVQPFNSRDVNLTARSLAPFPLAEKDWL
jgi:hypothetical protein